MPGGPVCGDALTVVSHLSPRAPGHSGESVYLGHLFIEPRRHAPGLPDLTDEEAQAVGLWGARASRALRDVAGAEHVYAAVIGHHVPHVHVHLLPRYPNTPVTIQVLGVSFVTVGAAGSTLGTCLLRR
jgi:diadenosine tetraphosphate (Ap4A) HIT family hydrolase